MAVRDWSGGTLAALWLGWGALTVALAWAGRPNPPVAPQIPRRPASFTRSLAQHDLSDSQAVILYYILAPLASDDRPDTTRQAALVKLLEDSVPAARDSLWRALGLPARLTAPQRDSIPTLVLLPVGRALNDISSGAHAARPGVWLRLLGLAVLAAGIPLILGVITLRWYVPRAIAKAAQHRVV
jgi:hypothetical protein